MFDATPRTPLTYTGPVTRPATLATLLLGACAPQAYPPAGTGTGVGSGTATGTATGTTAGTPGGTPTGTPGGTTEPDGDFDCATIPILPTSVTVLDGPRGYHDVAFTDDGYLLGSDGTNLIGVTYDGSDTRVLVPNLGMIQGMEWLPDGDLAVASAANAAILRVAPNGSTSAIASDIDAYGLILGPDQNLYAANDRDIWRIDPNTGAKTKILDRGFFGWGARTIQFNRDATRLYIGTSTGFGGHLYYLELDANLDPISEPIELASGVGVGMYHDGLGVDICGYLYVPDYDRSALYRVSPDGLIVQELLNTGIDQYGHGLEWGNGVGGFRTDALYQPLPYGGNGVLEVVIGVPRVWNGNVLNAPSP